MAVKVPLPLVVPVPTWVAPLTSAMVLLASALPVIAAESTGATNLVRSGVTGTLVDGSEPEEFAAALADYARDPDLRRRHGEAGLAVARTMDWDSINAAVIRAYKHAIVKRERLTRIKG